MNTTEFLRHVTPHAGNKVLAVVSGYTDRRSGEQKKGWRYTAFASVEAMSEAAQQFDAAGQDVYFGVNGFGDWYEEETRYGPKRRIRTQHNVTHCRALYDDFDVSDNPDKDVYRTRESAASDVARLATELRLSPTITSSGGGLHCYFTFTDDISAEEWLELSRLKRSITAHLGMRVDRAVDIDSARVLRPIGTHNHKRDTPTKVELLRAGKHYPFERVLATLQDYIETHNVALAAAPAPAVSSGGNVFAALGGLYPPSSAHLIAERCTALKRVADAGGNVAEPLWRAMLGLVKHTTEGDALCHEWSAGSPDYAAHETQAKLDHWNAGPTTCIQFDQHANCAGGCPHSGKIKSPIHLGYSDEAPSAEVVVPPPPPPPGITVDGELLPHWPEGFQWDGRFLRRAVEDAEGLVQWVPFTSTLLYVKNRVRDENGEWAILIRARESNGRWRELLVPTSSLASPADFAQALATHEIFILSTKNARSHMTDLTTAYVQTLQGQDVHTITISRFGWDEDAGTFVFGDRLLGGTAKARVIHSKEIPDALRGDFPVGGTLDAWVQNTDVLLNRPGAEMAQFALCHAFGAPLVRLAPIGDWHGIPFAMSGGSGEGKSAMAHIALSAFAHPARLTIQASEQGATIAGLIRTLSVVNGVPCLFDELSGRERADLERVAYAAGNGRDKVRLSSSGKGFATSATPWYTNTIVTSNVSIHAELATGQKADLAEGTQLRVFEVEVPKGYLGQVYPDTNKMWIDEHLDTNFGHAGLVYLRFVVENRDWVREQLRKALHKFSPSSTDESSERFYLNALATAVVAGKIAKRLGLVHFDTANMVKWVKQRIVALRAGRRDAEAPPRELVARFISSLHGRFIATKRIGDGRSPTTVETSTAILRQEPVARVAHEDKVVLVAVSALREWCRENHVQPAALKREMESQNLIVPGQGSPRSLAAGTDIAGQPVRVLELSYNALFGTGTSLRLAYGAEPKTTTK